MPLGEFDLIARWFARPGRALRHADTGIGDDCAIWRPAPGMQLAVSTDMLVEGRHFLPTVPPAALGHKALAVNLSDLAACGATPRVFTLALALPRVEPAFLDGFAQGLFALADQTGIELVGGDTTAGPLTLSLTVIGELPQGSALLRSGARAGDEVWISGSIGGARLALEAFRGTVRLDGAAFEAARRAMEWPQPRNTVGQSLRGLATSAVDLSDGLLGDLGHVLKASRCGAELKLDALPPHPALAGQPADTRQVCLLTGGDDYELLFTAPPSAQAAIRAAGRAAGVAVTPVGRIVAEAGLRVVDAAGQTIDLSGLRGFDHFSS
jgi:thiamine-monophosphate kinase